MSLWYKLPSAPFAGLRIGSLRLKSNLLIIIPTYNERGNIEELIRLLLQIEANPDILVIDDNSPDGTGEILDRLSLRHKGRVFVIHRLTKLGIGSAYLYGFRHALQEDYPLVLTMDADFSHHPKYIEKMLSKSEKSPIVIGSRYIKGGSTKNWGLHRHVISRLANFLAKRMLHFDCMDCTAGFRLYRKEVLESLDLHTIYSNGYAFLVEILYMCQSKGYRVLEIPIVFENRNAGASKISRKEIFKAVRMLFRTWLISLLRK